MSSCNRKMYLNLKNMCKQNLFLLEKNYFICIRNRADINLHVNFCGWLALATHLQCGALFSSSSAEERVSIFELKCKMFFLYTDFGTKGN